jgi:MFS family permease
MSQAEAFGAGPQPAGWMRWRTALALGVTVLVAYYDRLNISFAIPLIAAERGWSAGQTGDYGSLLMGLFYVGYGLSNLFLTPVAARFGPRRSLLVIVCLWALMTALGALASQVMLLFMASRVLLGLAEGVHFPMMNQLTKAWFPRHERSRANGLWIAGIYVAVLSAPLVLVPLMHRYGWRTGFLLLAAAGLLVSLPAIARGVFDRPGLHPRIGASERAFLERHASLEAGAEAQESPQRLGALLLRPAFALMLVAGILNNVVALGLSGWLPTYLAGRSGVRFEDLSYLAALPYAASFAGLLTWAILGDRTGRRAWLAAAGYLLAGLCILAALLAPALWLTVGLFGAATFFVASFTATEFALVQRMLPASHVAVGAGVYNGLSTMIGGGLGPLVVSGIVTDATAASTLVAVVLPCVLIAAALVALATRVRY